MSTDVETQPGAATRRVSQHGRPGQQDDDELGPTQRLTPTSMERVYAQIEERSAQGTAGPEAPEGIDRPVTVLPGPESDPLSRGVVAGVVAFVVVLSLGLSWFLWAGQG